jgi:hypothetical protein
MTIFSLILITLFPIKSLIEDEFYEKRTVLYRFLYAIPMAYAFRFGFYAFNFAADFFLFVNGFGAYPVEAEPKVGRGPTKPITEEMIENCRNLEYSYETMRSNNIYNIEMSPKFDSIVLDWNKTVQYWLTNFLYKRLPYKTHPWMSRSITFGYSTFMHGNDLGYVVVIFPTVIVMLMTDKMFHKNFIEPLNAFKYGPTIGFVIQHIRKLTNSYLFVAVFLQGFERSWRYSVSTNHLGVIILLIIYFVTLTTHLWRRNFFKSLSKRMNFFLY